jgi:c-di-GMP-binding flagellar brake protein YcgR
MKKGFERREHERHAAEIACKVRCSQTGRYLGALTTDLSAGGAMMTVQTPTPVREGQSVEIALRTDGRAIVLRSELVPARVVRCSSVVDRHQILAVRFDQEQGKLAAPKRAAAA